MYVNAAGLHVAFEIAANLLSRLTQGEIGASKPIISVEQLQDIIQSDTGVQIEKKEAVFEATYLRGRLERYSGGKRAIIHIRSTQDFGWKRFVSAKELIHIKMDGEEHFCPYGDETLEELIRKGHFGLASLAPPGQEPTQSEVIAEIAALEVLYPLGRRKSDVQELAAGTTTRVQLARRYGIPAHYAATAISEEYLNALIKGLNLAEPRSV